MVQGRGRCACASRQECRWRWRRFRERRRRPEARRRRSAGTCQLRRTRREHRDCALMMGIFRERIECEQEGHEHDAADEDVEEDGKGPGFNNKKKPVPSGGENARCLFAWLGWCCAVRRRSSPPGGRLRVWVLVAPADHQFHRRSQYRTGAAVIGALLHLSGIEFAGPHCTRHGRRNSGALRGYRRFRCFFPSVGWERRCCWWRLL